MEENKIPEGVQNTEAYQDYLEMKEAFEKSKERVYKTSKGEYIDFASPVTHINRVSEGLDKKERTFIDDMSHKYKILNGLLILKKKEAFIPKNKTSNEDVLKIKQSEILELFGRLFKVPEVLRIIKTEWGYETTRDNLNSFVKQNAEKIKSLQEEFRRDYSDVRLGYKRSRLDELTFLYNTTKQKYLQDEVREDAKLLQSLLEQIKKECDGDLVINLNAKVEVEQNVTLQIQNEMMKNFNITALVINKMAGKMNFHPNFIVSRLVNSHYAKFTGFKSLSEGESREEDEIFSPSGIVYNLDNIESKNVEITRELDKEKILPNISEEEKPKISSIRELLLQKLNESKKMVEKGKSTDIKH